MSTSYLVQAQLNGKSLPTVRTSYFSNYRNAVKKYTEMNATVVTRSWPSITDGPAWAGDVEEK
jgi:hypothetical protein